MGKIVEAIKARRPDLSEQEIKRITDDIENLISGQIELQGNVSILTTLPDHRKVVRKFRICNSKNNRVIGVKKSTVLNNQPL